VSASGHATDSVGLGFKLADFYERNATGAADAVRQPANRLPPLSPRQSRKSLITHCFLLANRLE